MLFVVLKRLGRRRIRLLDKHQPGSGACVGIGRGVDAGRDGMPT